MDFAFDEKTEELRGKLLEFMDSHIYPAEPVFEQQLAERDDPWAIPPVMDELKAEARKRGLWNFFLPGEHGAGLTNLQYAPLAEITGRSIRLAPTAVNCAAPDTGNMEVLPMFGNEQQQKQWLEPLLNGEIRSAFAMTEPDVASSDARNIETSIARDGDEYVDQRPQVVHLRRDEPRVQDLHRDGQDRPGRPRRAQQQSMILVPRDTPGVHGQARHARLRLRRQRPRRPRRGRCSTDVRVPVENLIAGEGDGFAIAQARLGPGRIHHCMRAIGMAERALELMCRRAISPRGVRQADRASRAWSRTGSPSRA